MSLGPEERKKKVMDGINFLEQRFVRRGSACYKHFNFNYESVMGHVEVDL
jgi:hypothetical protein